MSGNAQIEALSRDIGNLRRIRRNINARHEKRRRRDLRAARRDKETAELKQAIVICLARLNAESEI